FVESPLGRCLRGLAADAPFDQAGRRIEGVDIALDRIGIGGIGRQGRQRGHLERDLRKALARLLPQHARALQAALLALRPLPELPRVLGPAPGRLARAALFVAPERSVPPRPLTLLGGRLFAIGLLVAALLFGLIGAPGGVEQRRNQDVFDGDRPAHASPWAAARRM